MILTKFKDGIISKLSKSYNIFNNFSFTYCAIFLKKYKTLQTFFTQHYTTFYVYSSLDNLFDFFNFL